MTNKMHALSTTHMIMLSFLVVILVGSLLLSLPISSASGDAVSYIDALFTATTATCVTGLVTLPTVTTWSVFGQAVILLLIFITVFFTTRYVSLGSCVSSVMYPVLVYMFHGHDTYFIASAVVCAVLALYKHRSNIQRLVRGTESKIYFRK